VTLSRIEIRPDQGVVPLGRTRQLSATAVFSDGLTVDVTTRVQWASLMPDIALVSNSASSEGLVSTLALGETTVSAELDGVLGSTLLTVTSPEVVSLTVSPADALSGPGSSRQYQAMGTFSDGSTQDITSEATWSTADSSVATISSTGEALVQTTTFESSTTVTATVNGLADDAILTIGRFLYSANRTPGNVSGFRVNADGSVTELTTSPFAVGASVSSVDIHPSGRFLYVANTNLSSDERLSAFAIQNDGSLSELSSSPFATGDGAEHAAIHPSGKFLYTPNSFGDNISGFSIDANGALTELAGSPYPAGNTPFRAGFTPDGEFLFVPNFNDSNVSAYRVGSDGELSSVAGSPFARSGSPLQAAVDRTGQFLYVSGSFLVSGFTIGTDGSLTPLPGSPFTSAGQSGLVVHPTQPVLYVANPSINGFQIAANGALTPIAPFMLSQGTVPLFPAIDSTGSFFFAAYFFGGNLYSYAVDAAGVLSDAAGPAATAGNPDDVSVTP
jgi:6-phosphogluconolactonase (cycloisomerase 2 family)